MHQVEIKVYEKVKQQIVFIYVIYIGLNEINQGNHHNK